MSGTPALSLVHHDLCFGCGPVNPFGLQMELRRDDDGTTVGRFFVKQDHQGPWGDAHVGVLCAALVDAMAIATGGDDPHLRPARFELELDRSAPVGTFVHVEAHVERRDDRTLRMRADAYADADRRADRRALARARAAFEPV